MVPNIKEHSFPAIYLITNRVNGKIYVGSARTLYERYRDYRQDAAAKRGTRGIARAMIKYGFEQFEFSVLEVVEDKTQLLKREQHYLDTIKPFAPIGYNMSHEAGSTLGCPHSAETRAKISKAHMGVGGMAVVQIDPVTLQAVAEYPTIVAAAKAINRGPTVVYNVCRGIEGKRTGGGYLWCFREQYNAATYRPPRMRLKGGPRGQKAKPIAQMDGDGNVLRIWDHAKAAAKEVGGHPDTIRAVCKGRIKATRGYRWAFVTDKTVVAEVHARRKQEWEARDAATIG